MWSINSRVLVSAVAVLAAFLGLTGLALDKAFRESALEAVRDRLQVQIYLLLGAAETDAIGRLRLPEALPEARFSSPASGLFGELATADDRVAWRSRSTLERNIAYPPVHGAGESAFTEVAQKEGESLFAMSFGVIWEDDDGEDRFYVFRVAEATDGFRQQVEGFRRSLWIWLSAAAAVLLALQALILRWGLAPLRRVVTELGEVERGEKDGLSEDYPSEIRGLSSHLNAFIRYGQAQLQRYRNALDDLAHSLKTPLAVLRGADESGQRGDDLRDTLSEQVARMQQVIDYQLQRAAASGRTPLVSPIPVGTAAGRLTETLRKVYAAKRVRYSLAIEADAVFYGDEGDLTEILGNLIDNASKWARHEVRVGAKRIDGQGGSGRGLVMTIEDDGPGIPGEEMEMVLRRGGRSESPRAGQGIGLSVVREIVEDLYHGRMTLGRGPLGGACVELRFDGSGSGEL